ncbi:restriction endonuclease subunit S [Stutzerimonas chloritidismutans]|uniref:restriction endonuclease subunit S n=1 Tax=Stutzerimonas chloritidismutans TaxID=203192 RepID=UPI003F16A1FB
MSSELRKLWEHAGGQLPDDWSIVSFESLLRDKKSIAVGVMYPGPDTPGGVPLLKVGDVKDGSVPKKPSYCISAETDEEHKRTKLIGDELLITLVGNPGECVVVNQKMAGWNPARAIAVARLQDPSLRTYIKTVLESTAGRHLVDAVLNTTVQKTLNLKDIRKLPIPLPSSATIKGISSFSEALTMRITLLRETNATLEAIAQALFKSWFVDFDPVHAKAEGRQPEGMDATNAALFPDSFEDSELGLVPKGWRVGSIYEIARVIYGAPFASKQFNTKKLGLPLIRIRDLKNEQPGVYTEEVHSKGYLTQPGDIVVGMDGEFRSYIWGGEPAWLNQRVCVFKPNTGYSSAFVNYTIKPQLALVEATEIATTVIHLGKNDIDRFTALIPNGRITSAYSDVANPIYAKIVEGKQKAQTLTQLRDTLLPRLISGQLRLPEAEALVEALPA